MKLYLFLFSIISLSSAASDIHQKKVTIIIHGSFACSGTWHQPTGEFYESLKQNIDADEEILSFSWNGSPQAKKILLAGQNLATLLALLLPQTKIRMVAHSNGGRLINVALNYLDKEYQKEIAAAPDDYQIDEIYALGTPVSSGDEFSPNMNLVKAYYHLYSTNDFVQSCLGRYQQNYEEKEEGLFNILTFFIDKNGFYSAPSHWSIHNETIAHWLLKIPDYCKNALEHHGVLFLSEDKDIAPSYEPGELSSKKYLEALGGSPTFLNFRAALFGEERDKSCNEHLNNIPTKILAAELSNLINS